MLGEETAKKVDENKYDEYFKKTQNILTLNNDEFDSLSLTDKIKKLNSLCNEGKELVKVFIDSYKKSEEVKSLEDDNAEYIKMYNKINNRKKEICVKYSNILLQNGENRSVGSTQGYAKPANSSSDYVESTDKKENSNNKLYKIIISFLVLIPLILFGLKKMDFFENFSGGKNNYVNIKNDYKKLKKILL